MNTHTERALKLAKIAIENKDIKSFEKHAAIVAASKHTLTDAEIKNLPKEIKSFFTVDKEEKKAV